ncbi:hypothetical protein SSPS47_11260 [Streptomyces sp. S4.7]|nr:hypothetical protein SSPS47_11260 [Streptomyces sp. S4.7]
MASVAHAMAVRAQQGEIFEACLSWAGRVEGEYVVHFDVVRPQRPVHLAEVEVAHAALKGLAKSLALSDLLLPELGVAFTEDRPTGEKAPLRSRGTVFSHLVGLLRNLDQCTGADPCLKRTCCLHHLCFACAESFGDLSGELAASGRWSRIAWAAGDQGGALAADAGSGSELRKLMGGAKVQRERAQQLGKLPGRRLVGPELAPVTVDEARTDQQQLIPGPCRATHGQYRMRVRCGVSEVKGATSRAAQGRDALSVEHVTLCKGGLQRVAAKHVRKEGA